ncbi:hypothetical protein NX059_010094 [Plenodomus lindquistii]|nr:hypothetical protein NX059_010094 [Plenodomus lindquistii]
MAANIPKFASFRPKPKPAPDPPEEPNAKVTTNEQPVRSRKAPPPPPPSQPDKEPSSSKSYYSDRRGDVNVLRYGTLNRYDIPAYRRFGYGFVLGLSTEHKIDREESTSTSISITPTRRRQKRLLTDKKLNKSSHRALRLLNHSHDAQSFDQDFIPVTTSTLAHDSSDDENSQLPQPEYRDIQGRPNHDKILDPDTHYEPDADVIIDTEVTKRNSRLGQRTKEEPEHVQNWLRLIELQEDMLKLERPSDDLTASDKAHLAQVRISIYEEALKKTKTDQNSQATLWRGLLTEARRVWESTKLATKWKHVLAKHPYNTDLWWLYLDFMQSNFTSFKFEDCRSAFLQSAKALHSSPTIIPSETYLHILIRLTSMIYDCGYQELALAIWQATLELHLMRPQTVEGTAAPTALEEFWESEVARVGEIGAKGWKNSASSVDSPTSDPLPLVEADPSSDVLEDFQRRELDAMTKLQYPGRMTDEVREDDAFHTILFSDIVDYLDIVPFGTSAVLIVEAFLCFCGLPPLSRLAAYQSEWWSDPFLSHRSNDGSRNESGASQDVSAFGTLAYSSSSSYQMTTRLLFEQSFTLRNLRMQPNPPRQLLKLVASTLSDQDIIGEYLLAFESRHFPLDIPKTAKQLIKARPASLRLYNAYGLVESRRGNKDKANQVFSMALSIQKGGIALSTREYLQLYHDWVWEALHRGAHKEALWRLVSPAGKIPEPPPQDKAPDHDLLLQTRHLQSERSERALLRDEYEAAILSTSLQALTVYLTSDANVDAALDIHRSLASWMTSHKMSSSIYAEVHAQQIADLLACYATHAPIVKPALIRITLEPLIAQFPNNTILLSLYAANEARFAIDDRVRGIIYKNTLQGSAEPSVAGWMFAIQYEVQRGEVAGSTSHSVRALYQRATTSAGQHCPDLWISYLQFELKQLRNEEAKTRKITEKGGGKDRRVHAARQRVKDTFEDGLRQLPWCKEFVMLPFLEEFTGVFEDEKRWSFYRVMQEKEMRLYVELDESGR